MHDSVISHVVCHSYHNNSTKKTMHKVTIPVPQCREGDGVGAVPRRGDRGAGIGCGVGEGIGCGGGGFRFNIYLMKRCDSVDIVNSRINSFAQ